MPESELYSTERFEGSHRHEVFFGSANRQKSIKLGLVVFLAPEMHNMSNHGRAFQQGFDMNLNRWAENAMEKYNWSMTISSEI